MEKTILNTIYVTINIHDAVVDIEKANDKSTTYYKIDNSIIRNSTGQSES